MQQASLDNTITLPTLTLLLHNRPAQYTAQ